MYNNMQNGNINQMIQQLANIKNSRQNPQLLVQAILQKNPQMQQMFTQMQNMAGGRSPQEFLTQFAKQNGANEQSLQVLQGLFNK